MRFAEGESQAGVILQCLGYQRDWEATPLNCGDRVFFNTVEGDFPATVLADWRLDAGTTLVSVRLDCDLDDPITLHRSLFRAFNVLDHIAAVEVMARSE
jgi:hypothetical protein